MKTKLQGLFIACLLILANFSIAQYSTLSVGGEISSSSGNASYSLGQLAYSYFGRDNYSISEGVQQAYELSVTSIDVGMEQDIEVIAFPNPTDDMLLINKKSMDMEIWEYHMINLNGKVVANGPITGPQHILPIYHLPSSAYTLIISNGRGLKKSITIIKKNVQ